MAWTNLLGQVRVGVRGSVASPITQSLLLDTYSGAAAAYSLRKLNSSYSGSAIRVRRSSDNNEQNIGFNADGTLNTVALLAFVGAGNGFVTTWYDQSGNSKDATQTTSSSQPQIVSSGSLVLLSGKTSLYFGGSSYLITSQNVVSTGNAAYSVFGLGRPQGSPNCLFYIGIPSANNGIGLNNNNGTPRHYWFANDYDSSQTFANTNSIFVASYDGTKRYTTINNVTTSANSSGKNTISPVLTIGKLHTWGQSLVGYESELIIYDSNKESIRTNITSNINSYYSIYATDTDAQSFITAAGISDGTQIKAIDTLVTSLKSAGIWTKMKAIYPFVGGNATSHKFNLKDPRDLDAAFRLVFAGGWTHTSTGAVPNGTTGYADTKLNVLSVLTANNNHITYYSRTNDSTSNRRIEMGIESNFGVNNLNMRLLITGYWGITNSFLFGAGNATSGIGVSSTNTDSRGFYQGNILSSSNRKIYKNGILVGSNTFLESQSLANGNMYIGCTNVYDYPRPFDYTNKEVSFSSIGDGLTDSEATAFYNAVQAFQTSLGRQV